MSYADCECGGVCAAGRCAQWECPGHNRHHRFSLSSSPLAPSQSFNTQDLVDDLADEKQPPSSPRRLHYPARARSSPVRLEHLQEGDAALGAARQQEAAFNRARPALAAQPQIDAQLPSVASIASHRQLHDSIPYALQPLWQQICEPEFERYRQASQTLPAPDTAGMAASLISILQLPAKHLYKQRIPTSVRRMLRKQRYKDNDWQLQRLRGQLNEQAAAAAAAVAAAAAAAPAAQQWQRNGVNDEHHDPAGELEGKYNSDELEVDNVAAHVNDECTEEDVQAILRASRLVGAGHLDMASRAVTSNHRTLDCADPTVSTQLRAMHPQASNTPIPALPLDAITAMVRYDADLVRLVRRCDNGKAGGPSGWNGAMLAVLADSSTCMQGLRSIMQDITAGIIPSTVRPHLTATRLIALAKPNGKPRPIAMAELFYRIAAVRGVRLVADSARQLMGPHQYGVGVPGGCEHIVHCMQHSLSHIVADTPKAAVKICVLSTGSSTSRIPAVKGVSMVQARNILSHSSPVNPVPLLFLPC